MNRRKSRWWGKVPQYQTFAVRIGLSHASLKGWGDGDGVHSIIDVIFTQRKGEALATIRQRIGARMLHWYPFASGCGTLANHPYVQSILGRSSEMVWARTAHGRLQCSLADYVGRSAYYLGDLDPKVSWIIKRIVNPGDVALDIGANIGLVTLLLARCVGSSGSVHAFEPNPAVASMLQESIDENQLAQVILHRCGLGGETGHFSLSVPRDNAGAASFVRAMSGSAAVEVPVRTLDSIVTEHQLERIDFIKMDVEGAEASVLRGGMDMLASIRPNAILFEINEPDVDHKESEVIDLLREVGYRFFSIPRSLFRVRVNRFDPLTDPSPKSNDYLAVPLENYEQMASRLGAS